MKSDFAFIREVYDSKNDTHNFKLLRSFNDYVDGSFDKFNTNYSECFELMCNDIDELTQKNYSDYRISPKIFDTNNTDTWHVKIVDKKNLITYTYCLVRLVSIGAPAPIIFKVK